MSSSLQKAGAAVGLLGLGAVAFMQLRRLALQNANASESNKSTDGEEKYEDVVTAYRRELLQNLFKDVTRGQTAVIDKEAAWRVFLSDFSNLTQSSFPVDEFSSLVHSRQDKDNNLRFDLTPAAIRSLAQEVITRTKAVEDAVAKVAKGEHTWDNTVGALMECARVCAPLENSANFMQHVSTDKEVRDASTEADKELQAFAVESGMRGDVYQALKTYADSTEGRALSGEKKRVVDRLVRDFERNGVHLPAAKREQIKALQTKMSELSIQFQKNLGEEDTLLEFTKEELAGLPQDNFAQFKTNAAGKYLVSLKYPDYYPAMKYVAVEQTRKTLETAFNSRCIKENTPLIEELVRLRDQQAKLLGFPTHAAYILDIRMAKKPEVVMKFLTELSEKLDALATPEKKELLAYKEAEKKERGEKFDGVLNMWDFRYYVRMVEEKKYQVDHEVIKQYFPIDVVTAGLLNIYQKLLGLRFEEQKTNVHKWHEDVQLFNVKNAENGHFVGQFYLDLYPRPGKYGHAACFGLQPGCAVPKTDGARQYPVAACVANFPKPTTGKPSLLTHSDVTTYFHEFGHVMHQLCTEADYALFSGTAVERDFVEAPSQMLENWTWEKDSLLMMSGHFEDNSKKLPEALLSKLIAAKNANAGLLNKRQIVFGLLDQRMHTRAEADTALICKQVQKEVTGLDETPGTNFVASFGHLAGGYDATYYGYMWSEVYSTDMFWSRFKQQNALLSPKVGMDYRKYILAPGGSQDGADMLKNFLGRQPSMDYFLKSKGL